MNITKYAAAMLLPLLLSGCFRAATAKNPLPQDTADTSLPAETTADTAPEEILPYTVLENPGNLKIEVREEAPPLIYPEEAVPVISPDGKLTFYADRSPTNGEGGIFRRDSAGNVTQIFQNVPLAIGGSLSDVIYGSPKAFLDETHLLCIFGGYEHSRGCGIYDITTDTWTMHESVGRILGIHEGAVYALKIGHRGEPYFPHSLWKVSPDGKETRLVSYEIFPHEAWKLLFEQTTIFTLPDFDDGIWHFKPCSGDTSLPTLYLFSADARTLLAKIDLAEGIAGYSVKENTVIIYTKTK